MPVFTEVLCIAKGSTFVIVAASSARTGQSEETVSKWPPQALDEQ